jgi:hypothetical protein
VARPEEHGPKTVEEAVAALKRDPAHPVRLMLDGVEVELRRLSETAIIRDEIDQSNLGDRIAAIGPWQGESTEELIEILRGGRDDGVRKMQDLL